MFKTAGVSSFRTEHLDALQLLSLTEGVKNESLQNLAIYSQFQRFRAGVFVFDCGQTPDGVYLVMEGMVSLLAPDLEGKMHVAEVFGPGNLLGDLGLIWGSAYGVCAKTIRPSLLMKIPSAAMLKAIQNDGEFGMRIMGEHSRRIRSLLQRVGYYATDSSIARVASYLLNLPIKEVDGNECVKLPIPKHLAASLLNLSSEAFSRSLRSLKDKDLISVSKEDIVFISRQKLEDLLSNASTL
ncbi:hypothetical protein GCM10027046_32200 [Uliginosibacterium flavum]|uniref:Crp/Fnr family transcriptional regulator n=1 Tax=Uliginosibacterium flavum TaxID=1396831 RepID=A0ABV2TQ62_9RHOO